MLNIYLLEQNEHTGYDTHESIIVVARSEEEAKLINPDRNHFKPLIVDEDGFFGEILDDGEFFRDIVRQWASSIYNVKVTCLGILKNSNYKAGDIILSSFSAG